MSDLLGINISSRYERMVRKESDRYSHYNYAHWLIDLGPKFNIYKGRSKLYAGLGLNIGILHKNYEFITGKKYSENDFPVYSIAPYAGYCFPLSDKINFDINTKLIYWLGDNELGSLMFGAGIEYSL